MDDPFELPPDVLKRVPLFAEIQKVLSWSGGPVNWDLARQIAVSIAAGDAPGQAVSEQDHADVAEQVRVAELWLTDAVAMPTPTHLVKARAATQADRRLEECAKFGLRQVVAPAGTPSGKLRILEAETLGTAIGAGLDGDRSEGR